MTSVLRRIVDLIRTSLNALIDRAEDPEKMLDQMMRDLQGSYDRSRTEVARVLAEKHRLQAQTQQAEADASEWERRAVLALKSGDESLARKALERKRGYAEVAQGFRTQLEEQAAVAEKLKEALRGLENKLAEARVKRSLLSARHKRALAQRRIHQALEAAGSPTAFENLARLESRIEEMEAESLAAAELGAGELEEKFRELDAGDVEDDLLRLKAKLGEPKALSSPSARALPPAGA
jgi:phage shock protein A